MTTSINDLKSQVSKIKNDQKSELEILSQKIKELKAQARELEAQARIEKESRKIEEARIRAEKMKEVLNNRTIEPKINKSQMIREMLLQGMSKNEIVEKTGFSNKFCLDNIWRIEKEFGLR